MPSVAEFELAMRVSKDPSDRLGDLQDTVWEEENIQGLHALKLVMPIPSGAGPQLIPISALVDSPKMVVLQINKTAEVRIGSAIATPVTVGLISRYGYFIVTSSEARTLYIEPSEDAEMAVWAIGDE